MAFDRENYPFGIGWNIYLLTCDILIYMIEKCKSMIIETHYKNYRLYINSANIFILFALGETRGDFTKDSKQSKESKQPFKD